MRQSEYNLGLAFKYVNTYMKCVKSYAQFFAALADENRLRLLHLMRGGEICVCFLQGALNTNQPKISRHLAYLRRSGLVDARRDGKWMHYRLKKQPARFQRLLEQAFKATEGEPQVKRDAERAKQIQCCPSKFGLSSPSEIPS
jgi:ArsR family transcriptional regulator, arsenate/arsenite/antimonite-responsive transcriptional repressor